MRALAVGLVLCLAATLGATSAATPLDPIARARIHYDAAEAMFKLGRYREAMREFEAGFALIPRARFLVDIGQCHRMLGEREQAIASFDRFLAVAPVDDPLRAQIGDLRAELVRDLAAHPSPPIAAPATVRPTPPVPPPAEAHRISRWWWLLPAALLVAAGASLGIWYAVAGDPCGGATLGCYPTR